MTIIDDLSYEKVTVDNLPTHKVQTTESVFIKWVMKYIPHAVISKTLALQS